MEMYSVVFIAAAILLHFTIYANDIPCVGTGCTEKKTEQVVAPAMLPELQQLMYAIALASTKGLYKDIWKIELENQQMRSVHKQSIDDVMNELNELRTNCECGDISNLKAEISTLTKQIQVYEKERSRTNTEVNGQISTLTGEVNSLNATVHDDNQTHDHIEVLNTEVELLNGYLQSVKSDMIHEKLRTRQLHKKTIELDRTMSNLRLWTKGKLANAPETREEKEKQVRRFTDIEAKLTTLNTTIFDPARKCQSGRAEHTSTLTQGQSASVSVTFEPHFSQTPAFVIGLDELFDEGSSSNSYRTYTRCEVTVLTTSGATIRFTSYGGTTRRVGVHWMACP